MKSKKELNWFFVIIVFIIGLTLFKHIDFINLTLKEPALDILYIFAIIISVLFIVRKNKNTPDK